MKRNFFLFEYECDELGFHIKTTKFGERTGPHFQQVRRNSYLGYVEGGEVTACRSRGHPEAFDVML